MPATSVLNRSRDRKKKKEEKNEIKLIGLAHNMTVYIELYPLKYTERQFIEMIQKFTKVAFIILLTD